MYKTMEQINKEYDGQWVLMINCKKNMYHSVIGGEVVLHNENMSKVSRGMRDLDTSDGMCFIRFAGEPSERLDYL